MRWARSVPAGYASSCSCVSLPMANCFSAGVLMVGWHCSLIIAIRASGARRRASTAAVSPAIPLPTITISALSALYCLFITDMALLLMHNTPLDMSFSEDYPLAWPHSKCEQHKVRHTAATCTPWTNLNWPGICSHSIRHLGLYYSTCTYICMHRSFLV